MKSPTTEDQIYRIGGTTSGTAIFGGAVADACGGSVLVGIIVGGVLGFGLAAVSRVVFFRKVWAVLVETFAHPLSTSVVRIRGDRVRRRRLWRCRRGTPDG